MHTFVPVLEALSLTSKKRLWRTILVLVCKHEIYHCYSKICQQVSYTLTYCMQLPIFKIFLNSRVWRNMKKHRVTSKCLQSPQNSDWSHQYTKDFLLWSRHQPSDAAHSICHWVWWGGYRRGQHGDGCHIIAVDLRTGHFPPLKSSLGRSIDVSAIFITITINNYFSKHSASLISGYSENAWTIWLSIPS